jgi:hypothetical protein
MERIGDTLAMWDECVVNMVVRGICGLPLCWLLQKIAIDEPSLMPA